MLLLALQCRNCKRASKLTFKYLAIKQAYTFFTMKYYKLYWITMTTIYLLLEVKLEDNLLKHWRNSWTLEGHGLCAELLSKSVYDAAELPFFFLDKASICHRAIYSLRVRISMISTFCKCAFTLTSPLYNI